MRESNQGSFGVLQEYRFGLLGASYEDFIGANIPNDSDGADPGCHLREAVNIV